MTDSASEQICQYDRDGILTYVNVPFAAHLGLSCSGLVGQSLFDFMSAAERDDARARAASLSPANADHTFERESTSADGKSCWLSVTEHAVFDADNKVAGILCVRRDITPDKQFDLALDRLLQTGRSIQFNSTGFVSEVLRVCLEYLELDLGWFSDAAQENGDTGPVVSFLSGLDETEISLIAGTIEPDRPNRQEILFHEQAGQISPDDMRQSGVSLRVDIPVHRAGIHYGNLLLCSTGAGTRTFSRQQRFFVSQVATVVANEWARCRQFEELQRSERELSFIFDNTPMRLWFKDRDNRILRANDAAARWLKMPREDLVGHTTDEIFEGDLKAAHRSDLDVLETGIPERNVAEVNRYGSDDTNWVQVDKVPYVDTDTGALRVLTAANDVSDLKNAETALRIVNDKLLSQRETFRRHYRQTPVMLHSSDDTGYIIEVSEKWLSTLGYERHEVIGRRSTDFLTEESRHHALEVALPVFYSDGYIRDIPYQFVRKDGSLIDVEVSSILDSAGLDQAAMTFTVLTDVTERNQALAAWESKKADLEAANESLRQFAYVASHDLQEPLRKIQAFSDLLRQAMAEEDQDDVDYSIDVITKSATRARQLVSDLLTFSRTSNRKLEKEPQILRNVMTDVLQDLAGPIESAAAVVRVETGDMVVDADPTLLFQLLQNLLANALKYQAKGATPEILIGVERDSEGKPAAFYVQDNGIGIEAQYQDVIWEPFKRLHTRDAFSGTGIGLAICTSVAKRHDWTLEVQSEADHGATFIVRLPPG